MSQKMSKLQIRAEILNTIKILDAGEKHSPSFFENLIEPLAKIEDKQTVFEILVKELLTTQNNNRFLSLAFLTESIIPKEMIEEKFWTLLKTPNIDDNVKINIVNILKDLGNQIKYEKYTEYFENPESIIDADTEKLVKSAIYNPESLIDFLDFIEALPEQDKGLLIDSLCEDYTGDELANLFMPVLYANPHSDICIYAIKKLGESKSSLAIRPLNFILNFTNNPQIASAAKKSLTTLKLAGARKDNTEEFYAKVFETSKIDDVFISLPDGHGNVGILISRKRIQEPSLQMFAVVMNETSGIVDCFGFNDITQNEFNGIVNKFYNNEEKICIPPYVAKLLLDEGETNALKQNGKISYEYICWKNLLCDAQKTEEPLETILAKKLEKQEITSKELSKLYDTAIFDKWFIDGNSNPKFNTLMEDILSGLSEKAIPENNFETIVEKTSDFYDKIWTEEEITKLNKRLLLSAYLLNLNGFKTHANILFSLTENSETKKELTTDIIRKSVYEFFLRERMKHQNTTISTNIFSRRNEANKAVIGKKLLNDMIKEIEEHWSN